MTQTAEKPKSVKFKPVKLPVKFGSVSFDDATASIGIKIDLATINENKEQAVADLYRWLCNRHIKAQLIPGKRDDGETQGKLMPTDVEVNGTCDTNSLSVTTKCVGSRLTFALSEINASELAQFAKRDGYFTITSLMEQIDDESDKEDEDADDEE